MSVQPEQHSVFEGDSNAFYGVSLLRRLQPLPADRSLSSSGCCPSPPSSFLPTVPQLQPSVTADGMLQQSRAPPLGVRAVHQNSREHNRNNWLLAGRTDVSLMSPCPAKGGGESAHGRPAIVTEGTLHTLLPFWIGGLEMLLSADGKFWSWRSVVQLTAPLWWMS